MFERFTDRAREGLVLAQEEARRLQHNYIGTEHLLLGVARQGDGLGAAALRGVGFDADAARAEVSPRPGGEHGSGLRPGDADVLRSIGIDLDEVRRQAEEAFGPGALDRARPPRCRPLSRSNATPFTPRAKKVLELALRESLALRHNYIGTEHVLLGLLREEQGLAAALLCRQGIALDAVRSAVLAELGGSSDVGAGPRRRRSSLRIRSRRGGRAR